MLKKLLPVTLSIALLFAVNPALTVNAASINVSSTTIYNGIFIITLSGNLFTATGSADGDEHYKYHDGDAAILQELQDNIKINGISVSTLRAQGRSIAVNSTATNQIRITKGDDCYTASPYLSSLPSAEVELTVVYTGNASNDLQPFLVYWEPPTVSLISSMTFAGIPIFSFDGDLFTATGSADGDEHYKYHDGDAAILQELQDNIKINGISVSTLRAQGRSIAVNSTATNQIRITKGDDCYTASPYLSSLSSVTIELDAPYIGNTGNILQELSEVWSPNTVSLSSSMNYNGIPIFTLSGNLFSATGSADHDEHYKYNDGDAAILQGLQDNIRINGVPVSTLQAQGQNIAVNSTAVNQIRITKYDNAYEASPYIASLHYINVDLAAPYSANTGNTLQTLSTIWYNAPVSLDSVMTYIDIPIFTFSGDIFTATGSAHGDAHYKYTDGDAAILQGLQDNVKINGTSVSKLQEMGHSIAVNSTVTNQIRITALDNAYVSSPYLTSLPVVKIELSAPYYANTANTAKPFTLTWAPSMTDCRAWSDGRYDKKLLELGIVKYGIWGRMCNADASFDGKSVTLVSQNGFGTLLGMYRSDGITGLYLDNHPVNINNFIINVDMPTISTNEVCYDIIILPVRATASSKLTDPSTWEADDNKALVFRFGAYNTLAVYNGFPTAQNKVTEATATWYGGFGSGASSNLKFSIKKVSGTYKAYIGTDSNPELYELGAGYQGYPDSWDRGSFDACVKGMFSDGQDAYIMINTHAPGYTGTDPYLSFTINSIDGEAFGPVLYTGDANTFTTGTDSHTYYYDENGNLVRDRLLTVDGSDYIFDDSGILVAQREIEEPTKSVSSVPKVTASANASSSKVITLNGTPRLFVDGVQASPTYFFANTDTAIDQTYSAQLSRQINYAQTDCNQHLVSIVYWPQYYNDDDYGTFTELKNKINIALRGDPNAKVLLRITGWMTPSHVGATSDDIMSYITTGLTQDELDSIAANPQVSIASDLWEEKFYRVVARVVNCLRSDPAYADHVVGLQLDTGEWFQYNYREYGIDQSLANTLKFREWLTDKYVTTAALQAAWNSTDYTLSTAVVPDDMPNSRYRDPNYTRTLLLQASDRRWTDYLDYIGDMVASRITDLAEIIKYYSDSAYTTMFNYGYFYELWDAESGHYALNSVLDCPFIDFLAAPITYEDRGYRSAFVQPDRKTGSNLGTTSGYMSPVDTVTKAGKIWMQESDQMTFIKRSASLFMDETDALNMFGWLDNLGEVYEGHRREMGLSMIHGTGMWPMELRGEGWHDDPKIWQNYHQLQSFGLQYAKTSKTEASFEVAIVTDESAEGISRQNTETIRKLMSNTRFSANRAGTSISFVSLEDVIAGRADSAKLLIFVNPYRLTSDKVSSLRAKLHTGNKVSVFMYGFGSLSSSDIQSLTGMTIGSQTASQYSVALTLESGATTVIPGLTFTTATKNTSEDESPSTIVNPRYRVTAGQTSILGRYSDNSVGCALYSGQNYKTIFYGSNIIPPEAIRAFANLAGAQVFNTANDVVNANQDFIMLHVSYAGNKTITFNTATDVYDYFTDTWYTDVTSVNLGNLSYGATRYLFYGDKADIAARNLPKWRPFPTS